MTLIARLRRLTLTADLMLLVRAQSQLIADQQNEIRRLQLEHAREMRGLIGGWIVHIEAPEIDMRPELAELDRALAERAAALEEHVV